MIDNIMDSVFILRIEKYKGPETDILVENAYQSRTNAIKEMKEYWETEKKKWLKNHTWCTEDDFKFKLSSKGGYISYGWASENINFTLTRLKIQDTNDD